MYSDEDTLAGGLPHSDIHGSTPARGSPWLFAACHVLHRLLVPRHPPNALLILDQNTPEGVPNTMHRKHPQTAAQATPERPTPQEPPKPRLRSLPLTADHLTQHITGSYRSARAPHRQFSTRSIINRTPLGQVRQDLTHTPLNTRHRLLG